MLGWLFIKGHDDVNERNYIIEIDEDLFFRLRNVARAVECDLNDFITKALCDVCEVAIDAVRDALGGGQSVGKLLDDDWAIDDNVVDVYDSTINKHYSFKM